jgi:sugar-specific transcriptional regulator TrmB
MAIIDHNLEHKIRLAKKELERGSPHIQWYIEHLNSLIKERDDVIEEYRDFFNTLDKFLPNKEK